MSVVTPFGICLSANILLDQNFEARIGDFGLAREGPNNQYTHIKVSRVHGTRPYLPDEFLRSKQISSKVDTYSFGIVLFELATGLRAYDDGRARKFLKDYVEFCEEEGTEMSLIDKRLEVAGADWVGAEGAAAAACPNPEYNLGSSIFVDLLRLGKFCVKRRPGERPEMVLVLQELDGMAARREIACRAQNLMRINSLTPTNPYERQYFHDQWMRMSPQPMSPQHSPQRASSPTGLPPNPGISVGPPPPPHPPPHPASATSSPSTVPSPQIYLHNNPPRFSNNPQGAIAQYKQWHNPSNNHMVAMNPNVHLAPRVPSVLVQPPSPIPLEEAFQAQQGANNGNDGSKGSQPSYGVQSSMTVPYSEEFLPATIPGQGSDSITETLAGRVGGESPRSGTGICDEVTVCASQLLPRISLLGIEERSNQSGEVAGAAVPSSGPPHLETSASQISAERSGPKPLKVTALDKTTKIFDDD